ncbi:hypothetical protein IQ07DRAFT_546866 [Pyrenochaeta sp. DS3sAY3a]|nr:hypothetical protein IQ07DRAFT_546866 [Pyrenochaeta sp. DS3sAY3a]
MQFLLPLLISSSLVSASRHHARDVIRTRTAVTTTTVTVYSTVYADDALPPTQPTPEVVLEAEANSVVVAEGKPTEVAPAPAPTEEEQPYTPSSQPSPPEASPASNDRFTTQSAGDSTLERMATSDVTAKVKTCWGGKIPWPLPNTPNPVVDEPAPQLSIFARPATKANTLTVHNYCSYDLYFNNFDGQILLEHGKLAAKSSIERSLGGDVMKVSKTNDMAKDVLIEYNVDGGLLWYDLSLITCIGRDANGLENGDLKDCAGHEAGLQLGNSNANYKSFQCAPGAWCDDQVYLYQENLCKAQNPVFACNPNEGLTMEFCASQKA